MAHVNDYWDLLSDEDRREIEVRGDKNQAVRYLTDKLLIPDARLLQRMVDRVIIVNRALHPQALHTLSIPVVVYAILIDMVMSIEEDMATRKYGYYAMLSKILIDHALLEGAVNLDTRRVSTVVQGAFRCIQQARADAEPLCILGYTGQPICVLDIDTTLDKIFDKIYIGAVDGIRQHAVDYIGKMR